MTGRGRKQRKATVSPLRQLLNDTCDAEGCTLNDITVLSVRHDPFRLDTSAHHRDGKWLADTIVSMGLTDVEIHLRGLHYPIIGWPKPDGVPYTNTDKDWEWLQSGAGKAARWLGYVPFDQIIDQRNAAPIVERFSKPLPAESHIYAGLHIAIPEVDEITPWPGLSDFTGMQPNKLVLFGEKSSLAGVLRPIAERYHADMYLMTGEISDTHVYRMAEVGAADGRPMVVLTFCDSDPSGWQMAVSIGRKLQGFKALHFPDLDFRVYRVALTPQQVKRYDLPSTPLKAGEDRALDWCAAMGVEQTEIDSLASLRPDLLAEIADAAIRRFYDVTLTKRVAWAEIQWGRKAKAALADQIDGARLTDIETRANRLLATVQEDIYALNDEVAELVADVDLPEVPEVPTAELDHDPATDPPLIDSVWPFIRQSRRMIDSKAYRLPEEWPT